MTDTTQPDERQRAIEWLNGVETIHELQQGYIAEHEKKIYATIRAALAPVAVEGWKLVPIEPTREQLDASNWPDARCLEIYQAMVVAAPKPPEQSQVEAVEKAWREVISYRNIVLEMGAHWSSDENTEQELEPYELLVNAITDYERERNARYSQLGQRKDDVGEK